MEQRPQVALAETEVESRVEFRGEEEGKAAKGVEEVLGDLIVVRRGDDVVAEAANEDDVGEGRKGVS